MLSISSLADCCFLKFLFYLVFHSHKRPRPLIGGVFLLLFYFCSLSISFFFSFSIFLFLFVMYLL